MATIIVSFQRKRLKIKSVVRNSALLRKWNKNIVHLIPSEWEYVHWKNRYRRSGKYRFVSNWKK